MTEFFILLLFLIKLHEVVVGLLKEELQCEETTLCPPRVVLNGLKEPVVAGCKKCPAVNFDDVVEG